MPHSQKKCIEGWKRLMPDYTFMCWDESTFDYTQYPASRYGYEAKKYALVSDVCRYNVLAQYGGIYLDTDIEIIRPVDSFLSCKAFMGFESRDRVGTAVIGAEANMPFLQTLLDIYKYRSFRKHDGSPDLKTNVEMITSVFIDNGFKKDGKKQTVNDVMIYPQSSFYPNTVGMIFKRKPRNSYTIHHYSGSWIEHKAPESEQIRLIKHYLGGKLRNILGAERYSKLRGL